MENRIAVQLLDPCDDKQEAEKKQHEWAATLKNLGFTPMYRAKVLYRQGWGVWLTKESTQQHEQGDQ
jgi:hypothetical protein